MGALICVPKKEGLAEIPNNDGCFASGDLKRLGADTGEVKAGVYVLAGTEVTPPKREEEADAEGLTPNKAEEGEGVVTPKRDPGKGF